MPECQNTNPLTGKRCGSFAINADTERKICDVCYAYRKGQEDMKRRAWLYFFNQSTDPRTKAAWVDVCRHVATTIHDMPIDGKP